MAAPGQPKPLTAEEFVLVDALGEQRGAILVSRDGMATVSW